MRLASGGGTMPRSVIGGVMMRAAINLFVAALAIAAGAGCASQATTGAAQAESRSLACEAACKQVPSATATATATGNCDECVCDRMTNGPAVCTATRSRN